MHLTSDIMCPLLFPLLVLPGTNSIEVFAGLGKGLSTKAMSSMH